MKIAEIYTSVQGEGLLAGRPSIFLRTSGCNLRCWFCDTPYTSWAPEGKRMSVEAIASRVAALEVEHVVVTGGEPMLPAEIEPLTRELRRLGRHVTIETAGTVYRDVACELMSVSPKLSGSTPSEARDPYWHAEHQRRRHRPEIVRRLIADYTYQLKFVVDRPADCDEVQRYLAELPGVDRSRVLLMPQGTDVAGLRAKAGWLEPYCRESGLAFCPRKQIEWFGLTRGT